MRKLVLWAVAGLAVLFLVMVLLITSLGDGHTPDSSPSVLPPQGGASGAQSPLPGPQGLPPRQPVATPPSLAPPVEYGPPPTVPPEGSWEAVPPVSRLSALGPVGAGIGRELAEMQPHLAGCFSAASQARYAGQGVTSVNDEAPLDDSGTTILMIQLETMEGSVRIVDAPVETRGGAKDALIACVQQALRGQVLPVPQARAGARHRVLFPLMQ